MPWHVSKSSQCPASRPYGVILDATGKVIKGGCHETKAKAVKHMQALYVNEPKAAEPKARTMPALITLPGVDIVATGTWKLLTGEATFTAEDLANAIDASQCPSIGSPVIKIGHIDPRFDGEPAVGRVANMALSAGGNKITGDLAGMPGWLGEAAPSAYPNRSIEAFRDVTCQQGHTHPFVITALALLGVTRPAIGVLGDLEDVATLYGVSAAEGAEHGEEVRVSMGEQVLAAGITVDDVRKQYMQAAGYSMWIAEIQLSPPQLIVCDEATDKVYRVAMKISGGSITFGDPVEVAVEYVDVAARAPALAHFASREQAEAGLEAVMAAWDAGQQEKNLGQEPSASAIKAMYAIPGSNKSDSKLPHHDVSSDGTVGAANPDGCSAAIGAINGGRGGLTGVSTGQKKSAYSHLAAHLRSAGKEPPELKAAGNHAAYTGTHDHPHPAMDSQGGDATHAHSHSHDGHADHNHQHKSAASDGKPATGPAKVKPAGAKAQAGTRTEEGSEVFTDEQLATLRAELGLEEDAELTGEQVLAAFASLKAKSEGDGDNGDGEPEPVKQQKLAASVRAKLPAGAVVIDQAQLEALQHSAKKGEEALRRIQVGERDQIIMAAVSQGKFTPARVPHWQRAWDADPDGARELIASLQRNIVPLHDIGRPGGAPGDEDEMDEEFRHLFPPVPKG